MLDVTGAMAAIQKLGKQAWDVFRAFLRDKSLNNDSLKPLKESMTKIQASDLNFHTDRHKGIVAERAPGTAADLSAGAGGDVPDRAPVGYMHIFEDDVLSMGVFIIREGSRIPLHNHRGMCGLLKVLYGNIRVRSYDSISDDWTNIPTSQFEGFPADMPPKRHLLVPTRLGIDDKLIDASSETVLLTPNQGNYHSLESVGGPAAFVDILSPPYDPVNGRDCYYFKELKPVSPPVPGEYSDVRWLMIISSPRDFWCDDVDYPGPEVSITSS